VVGTLGGAKSLTSNATNTYTSHDVDWSGLDWLAQHRGCVVAALLIWNAWNDYKLLFTSSGAVVRPFPVLLMGSVGGTMAFSREWQQARGTNPTLMRIIDFGFQFF
jgi:hypothetical protein